MGNNKCLTVTLKGEVTDSSLPKFGELTIKTGVFEGNVIFLCRSKADCLLSIKGDAYFSTSPQNTAPINGTEEESKEIVVGTSMRLTSVYYKSSTSIDLVVSDKYSFEGIAIQPAYTSPLFAYYLPQEELHYCTNWVLYGYILNNIDVNYMPSKRIEGLFEPSQHNWIVGGLHEHVLGCESYRTSIISYNINGDASIIPQSSGDYTFGGGSISIDISNIEKLANALILYSTNITGSINQNLLPIERVELGNRNKITSVTYPTTNTNAIAWYAFKIFSSALTFAMFKALINAYYLYKDNTKLRDNATIEIYSTLYTTSDIQNDSDVISQLNAIYTSRPNIRITLNDVDASTLL